jgi:hypothetical protein
MAEFSATAASAGGFFRDAQETPSGLPSFDAAYQILSLTQRIPQVPIDAGLAERILKWPSDAVAPQEILAWRDSFGLHLHAHLPATPNWGTITHFVGIAQDFCARLPVPVMTGASKSFWDRLLGRILES